MLKGNKNPAPSQVSCTLCKMQPASTVIVKLALSRARTRFMRCRLKTTWVPVASGVEPTTMPVLPPCGTMLTRAAAQAFTTKATSCVLAGRTTASALPRSRLRQSSSQALRSPSVCTLGAPTVARRDTNSASKWLMDWRRQVQFGPSPWRYAGAGGRAGRRLQTAPGTAAPRRRRSSCSGLCRCRRAPHLR